MSSIHNLNLNRNIDQFIAKLGTVVPDPTDLAPNNNSSDTFAMVQIEMLKLLKDIKSGNDSIINELAAVKLEMNDYKTLTMNYEKKIQRLKEDNKILQ